MDRTIKGVIAAVLLLIILAAAAYGSYLPMRKAQTFIATLQSFQAQPPTSLQDLETRLSVPLDYPSPIGQEELVRNTANSMLGLVQRGIGSTSTAELMGFLNSYYNPILDRGKGMSFGQDLYLAGAVNEMAFVATGGAAYLTAAQKYYEEGLAFGPNRPQSLYGLFDIYRAMGNVTGTEAIAQKILASWPTDQNISAALTSFLNTTKK